MLFMLTVVARFGLYLFRNMESWSVQTFFVVEEPHEHYDHANEEWLLVSDSSVSQSDMSSALQEEDLLDKELVARLHQTCPRCLDALQSSGWSHSHPVDLTGYVYNF